VITLVFCLRRRSDLTFEEFDAYWRDVHGPLVRAHAETLGIRRYVQLPAGHARITQALSRARGGVAAIDGVAQAWYDSVEAFVERGRDTEVRRLSELIAEDEARFLDLSASSLLLGDEREIVAPQDH
jgi:uncharacterized protein (TIGR02118 family)